MSRRDLAATRMGRGLLHAWRCWTRLPYPDTVLHVSALPVVQQPYGAATTGN